MTRTMTSMLAVLLISAGGAGVNGLLAQTAVNVPATAQTSPYLGQEKRAIKALSDQETADILAGKGVGLARSAELNHYPGPLHVVQLKEQLALNPVQTEEVQAIFNRMSGDARVLGKEWIDRERVLESGFAQHAITADQISVQTMAIGNVQGRLRDVHLTAHLKTKAVLTPEQIAKYDALRGYQAGAVPGR
jgi:hypothetical protein